MDAEMLLPPNSAKIRSGPPNDDKKDLEDDESTSKTWTGVIPGERSAAADILRFRPDT